MLKHTKQDMLYIITPPSSPEHSNVEMIYAKNGTTSITVTSKQHSGYWLNYILISYSLDTRGMTLSPKLRS